MSGFGKKSNSAPIGVFDSGVGGLTVAREIMRQIPDERIVYFGDTARVPYGSKSKETIVKYSRQIIRFLQTKEVKAIVVACNTASAYALEEIQKDTALPLIGVIRPGAKVASRATRNRTVGVIGTEGTIGSGMYDKLIRELDPGIQVIGKACPLFVPLVEEGWAQDPVTEEVASRYLKELREQGIDTLILGCTHYPLLREIVAKVMGPGVELINPAYETAASLRELLVSQGLANGGDVQEGEKYQFYVSDAPDRLKRFTDTILPIPVRSAAQIHIEQY